MKNTIKELLIKQGYKKVKFEEHIFDMEDYKTIIAYNFMAINKDKKEVLVSVETEEDVLTIWESLEGFYDSEEWWFIDEVAI